MDLIRVNNLKVDFELPEGRFRAVDGLSLRVRAGSVVALVGESGSGKSVTAQAIMGILPRAASITGGEILFHDPESGEELDLAKLPPDGPRMRALRGSRISIIFQEPMSSLSPLHTIGDQIGEVLHLHRGMSRAEAKEVMVEMFRLTGFPDPVNAHKVYPYQLSGGLRQRAMIAMALVCRPGLVIADEPTTALDVTIQAQILKLLRDLQVELGMAVLMITHNLGVVANLAEELVVAYRGRVVESGTVQDLFSRPGHPYLQALFRAVPRSTGKDGERLQPIREIKLEKHLISAEKALHGKDPRKKRGQGGGAGKKAVAEPLPLLEVKAISKTYAPPGRGWFGRRAAQGVKAVDEVSFSIAPGECVGLVGESGCGKSTACKILLRALTADEGEIRFRGGGRDVNLLEVSGEELLRCRRSIQYIFQDPFSSLNPRMTVNEIISEPLVIHGIGSRPERMERVRTLMQLVGLEVRHLSRYPHSFSGGQRQRIGIARALALNPELLICDEPVSALDVSVQAQVLNLLKDLQQELGLTMLFVSHDLAVVKYMVDRVLVMCAGRVVESAPVRQLFRKPNHPYTRALLAAVPEPDLRKTLDFDALVLERASDPASWPEPYRLLPGVASVLKPLGNGHEVRVSR